MIPRKTAVGLVLALMVLGAYGFAAGPAHAATSCPSVGTNWAAPGPFSVTSASTGAGNTIYRPTSLGGCGRHPVILWSNGAAAQVSNYDALLRHFASHGFIVAAAENRSADPARTLAGLDYLTSQDSTSGSVYFGRVDLAHVGATGHSLGGGTAVGAGADPRVDTVAPLLGGPFNSPADLHGPALFFAAQLDLIVWPSVVEDRYRQAGQVPAIYAELAGAGHGEPSPDGGAFRGPVTAWFRYLLMGDPLARSEFFGPNCVNCTSSIWSSFERNPRAEAF